MSASGISSSNIRFLAKFDDEDDYTVEIVVRDKKTNLVEAIFLEKEETPGYRKIKATFIKNGKEVSGDFWVSKGEIDTLFKRVITKKVSKRSFVNGKKTLCAELVDPREYAPTKVKDYITHLISTSSPLEGGISNSIIEWSAGWTTRAKGSSPSVKIKDLYEYVYGPLVSAGVTPKDIEEIYTGQKQFKPSEKLMNKAADQDVSVHKKTTEILADENLERKLKAQRPKTWDCLKGYLTLVSKLVEMKQLRRANPGRIYEYRFKETDTPIVHKGNNGDVLIPVFQIEIIQVKYSTTSSSKK